MSTYIQMSSIKLCWGWLENHVGGGGVGPYSIGMSKIHAKKKTDSPPTPQKVPFFCYWGGKGKLDNDFGLDQI